MTGNAVPNPDLVVLFDWVARVVVRFQAEGVSLDRALLRGFLKDQGGPDLTPLPDPSDSAKLAFETACLEETPPAWLIAFLVYQGVQVPSARTIELFASLSAGFQDVPGAVEALRSVVLSSDFPLLDDIKDVTP